MSLTETLIFTRLPKRKTHIFDIRNPLCLQFEGASPCVVLPFTCQTKALIMELWEKKLLPIALTLIPRDVLQRKRNLFWLFVI